MLVYASATLHWLLNWTMNWIIVFGTQKCARKKGRRGPGRTLYFLCGPMIYSSSSQISGEIWWLVLFTNRCRFVKPQKSMSRWLLLWKLTWLLQIFWNRLRVQQQWTVQKTDTSLTLNVIKQVLNVRCGSALRSAAHGLASVQYCYCWFSAGWSILFSDVPMLHYFSKRLLDIWLNTCLGETAYP